MKRIALSLVLTGLLSIPLVAEVLVVPAAATVSSIPLLSLDGETLAGSTLSVPLFSDHALALAGLLTGESQALFTGSTLGIKKFQASGSLVHLLTPVWDVSGLVTFDPSIQNLADLAGKKVVLPLAGGPLDVQFRTLLKARGLDGQVSIDYAEPPQAAALLTTKKVDAAALPEPLVSRLVVAAGARQIFTFAEAWATINQGDGRAPQVSLLARGDWAAAHRPQALALVEALTARVKAVQADPARYAALYAAKLGLPAAVVERGLRQTRFDLPDPATTVALYQAYQRLTGDFRPLAEDYFFR